MNAKTVQLTSARVIAESDPILLQVPELPVYGVAIPTVAGLRLVLAGIEKSTGETAASGVELLCDCPLVSKLGNLVVTLVCCPGTRPVLWHNMREEPVLYINGKPYVVRESNKPFANLEYTGALPHLCLCMMLG